MVVRRASGRADIIEETEGAFGTRYQMSMAGLSWLARASPQLYDPVGYRRQDRGRGVIAITSPPRDASATRVCRNSITRVHHTVDTSNRRPPRRCATIQSRRALAEHSQEHRARHACLACSPGQPRATAPRLCEEEQRCRHDSAALLPEPLTQGWGHPNRLATLRREAWRHKPATRRASHWQPAPGASTPECHNSCYLYTKHTCRILNSSSST